MSTELREARQSTPPNDPGHERFARDRPEEEAQKSYHTVLEQHLQQAQDEIERPAAGLLLSAFSAGFDLGFGPLLMAIVASGAQSELHGVVKELLLASAYTVGFIYVVVGRSVLFTEQTTSAVLPVLAGRASIGALFRLWGLVLAANLVGCTASAWLFARLGTKLGIIEPSTLASLASRLLDASAPLTLLSGIAAGWLMGLLAWLVVAARDSVSQILLIFATTFVIGMAGFHHSIAGSVEVLMAVFAGAGATLGEYGAFVVPAAIGNAIGGALFVALLKFGHVRASSGS